MRIGVWCFIAATALGVASSPPGPPRAAAEVSHPLAGAAGPRVSFSREVVPTLTRLGCNTGACHGKMGGQNGFALSLFGFDPAEDFGHIVTEADGKRLRRDDPPHSLLLRKATHTTDHEGGKRTDVDSEPYRLLLRWVEQGAPADGPGDPTVRSVEVSPPTCLMHPGDHQPIKVTARLSDGSSQDVTALTTFAAGDAERAEISDAGLVTAKALPGTSAVLARYMTFVASCRVTVPLGAPVEALPPERNFVDHLVFARLKELGLPPSARCDDATFIRRVTIDIAGRLPTPEEVSQFLADGATDNASGDRTRYERLVDRLLSGDDYAWYFANKWGAVLRNRRSGPSDKGEATAAFHRWIFHWLRDNKPYDRFAREILTATGEEVAVPPVAHYRELREPDALAEDTAQLFLGQRIGCAKCHHHPFERWTQQDYWGFAACFARLDTNEPKPADGKEKKDKKNRDQPKPPLRVTLKPDAAPLTNPRTHAPVPPAVLGGEPLKVDEGSEGADPREKLADWMTDPSNPFFARTLVNRYWKHFFGRGLVDPEDDMRATNAASNPELLDALAADFVEHHYDLKRLVRTICTSSTYRLGAVPNRFNADDTQSNSRFVPRRLNAEVLLDALDVVTQTDTRFPGQPADTPSVRLPDNASDSYFLGVFGRPDAGSACECERNAGSSLPQALHLFNSREILAKVGDALAPEGPKADAKGKRDKGAKATPKPAAAPNTRSARYAADPRPTREKVRELYHVALSREPNEDELAALTAHVDGATDPRRAWSDVVWALVNTKEFLFNH